MVSILFETVITNFYGIEYKLHIDNKLGYCE